MLFRSRIGFDVPCVSVVIETNDVRVSVVRRGSYVRIRTRGLEKSFAVVHMSDLQTHPSMGTMHLLQ